MSRIVLNARAQELIKPFQAEDADRQIPVGRAILGHKTGMGKTLIALRTWAGWNFRRALILGSVSGCSVWLKQPDFWTTGMDIEFLEAGSKNIEKRFQDVLKAKDVIAMATYPTFVNLMKKVDPTKRPEFDVMVNEELHKIRNRQTERAKTVHRVKFDKYIGMSATWATRGPQDLWTVMKMVEPDLWGSYWKWVNTWCHVDDGLHGGKEIYGIKNLANLRTHMAPYYRSRSWPEVGIQFPPTIRQPIILRLNKEQRRMHDELSQGLMTTSDSGELIVTPTNLAKVTRLRQLCVTPRLLDRNASRGAAIDYLMDQIEEDPHTVVFTPFAEACPIIEQELRDAGHQNIFTFTGGLRPAEINRREDLFKRSKGIALVSIAFAESFALDTTNLAHFLGYEWDPNLNIQAEGRLRRLDSELIHTPVYARYTMHEDTIEDHLKYVVNQKVQTVKQLFPDFATMSERSQHIDDLLATRDIVNLEGVQEP
jgi:SNF2 family DNA or RNA helicase